MFRHLRYSLVAAGLWTLLAASSAPAWESEADLLAVLKDQNASLFDKGIACKQLAVVGTEKAVPVLAELLQDEKLAHYARYGLEPIPSPKVDAALTDALSKLKGRTLIGVIDSIGNRGKPGAIDALAAKLDDDPAVAAAAAHAIARLGTPKAAEILQETISARFAPACLVCAKTLVRQGRPEEAARLLAPLAKLRDAPEHVRLAAMLQAIQLPGAGGRALLTASLTSDDPDQFNMGLRAARLPQVGQAAEAVLDAIKDAPPARSALLLTLLGDLADPAGLPAVVAAVRADNEAVRVAALEALAAVGGPQHVPLLMDAAMDDSETVSERASETLASLSGEGVDEAILARLDDPARQTVAIELAGRRRIAGAASKLLPLLRGAHQVEVVASLGETVTLEQLDPLTQLLSSDSADLREAARQAVHAACARMPDRDAAATKLAGCLRGASEETVQFVMNELRLIGGDEALAIVGQAAQGSDVVRKDYATQALGEWLDTSPAPLLLDLAKKERDGKFGVRALRGYIRLIRQFSIPDEQRVAMARTALQTAARLDEKKLLLEALEQYPSVDTLRIAVEASKDAALKEAAGGVALAIAQKLGRKSGVVRTLLSQVDHEPVKLEILRAEYGAGSKWKDVTTILADRAGDFPLIVLPSARYNNSFGGDPAPSTPKVLKVKYRINGKEGEATFRENAPILLPTPK